MLSEFSPAENPTVFDRIVRKLQLARHMFSELPKNILTWL